jgi:hypothetical protein
LDTIGVREDDDDVEKMVRSSQLMRCSRAVDIFVVGGFVDEGTIVYGHWD